jgi:FtsZ-interacting cell division protein ZipA
MSDLQMALLLTGVVVVLVVLIFNWNQERRFRKQAATAFAPPERDALLDRFAAPRENAERIEPGMREVPPARVAQVEAVADAMLGARREPVAVEVAQIVAVRDEPVVYETPPPTPVPAAPAPPAPYDELIEYRAHLVGEMRATVFADVIARSRTLGKPVRWSGYSGSVWEELQPWREVQYQEVQVALQIADRNGAVQQSEFDTLCALLHDTAQKNGLRLSCDDVAEALERAQTVDHFCVDVDVLIGLNIVARGDGGVLVSKVLREAQGAGMVLGVDGSFQLIDSRGEALYTLCNHDAEPFSPEAVLPDTPGVTLQFDVPHVPDGLQVFDGMVSFGRKLANEVGGLLVDDNMRPLTDSGIDKIRQQLASIYQRMDTRGIPSGSRRALRLFS